MSRKSERLVNLTIALLASKRYLTKSEIFRTVEGYEGAPEAMERMFERDKDDLRSLGIVIELGTFDPLFGDEAGYRITPSTYRLDLGELDGADIALLSIAASAWTGAALERESTSALIKLASMGLLIGIISSTSAITDTANAFIIQQSPSPFTGQLDSLGMPMKNLTMQGGSIDIIVDKVAPIISKDSIK